MKLKRYLMSLLVIAVQFFTVLATAITKEMQETVTFETKANAAAARSDEKIMLEHYEIPLEFVEKDIAARAPQKFVDSLIFERDGKKYLRWVINPEDSKWHLRIARLLDKYGLSTRRHTYFEGYQTASRSYIAVDPHNGAEFSVKVSTNKTGGAWRDKKQTWADAQQIRKITDFVDERVKSQVALQNIILLDEPMAFGLRALDQGMVIRSYEPISNSGNHYVPGFSIMHEKTGRSLALKNHALEPAAYWNKHYNQPLARAIAEFAALSGMTYDSPHSQNFLVELSPDYKPTGKIVLRDFGDTYLSKNYFEVAGRPDILKIWEPTNVKDKYLPVSVGILHGNKTPAWMDLENDFKGNKSYDQWGRDFFVTFHEEFAKQTGLRMQMSPIERDWLKDANGKPTVRSKYISRTMYLDTPEGRDFLSLVKKGRVRSHLQARFCSQVFAM